MKIIFIYGAPGVGKLTTAKELAKITGFKVLHNHLINDLVDVIFNFGEPGRLDVIHAYRTDLVRRASRVGLRGMIMTFVYAKPTDNAYLKSFIQDVRKVKAKILFVHLICDNRTLLKRIKHPSRKPFGKIKTHKTLRGVMKRHDVFSDVPYSPNLAIDNTKKSPKKVAELIRKHYSL